MKEIKVNNERNEMIKKRYKSVQKFEKKREQNKKELQNRQIEINNCISEKNNEYSREIANRYNQIMNKSRINEEKDEKMTPKKNEDTKNNFSTELFDKNSLNKKDNN